MTDARRKIVRRLGYVALAALVVWLASSFAMLHALRSRARPARTESPPKEWAARCESLRLRSADGVDLGAWFVESEAPRAPVAILLHGQGGSRSSRVGFARVFQRLGCSTLLVTLRGHGDSSGDDLEFGWSERADVLAAVDWAEQRAPGSKLLLSGFSLGGAASVFAARELGDRIAGYELECLYTDLDTAASRRCSMQLPPVLDFAAHLGLRTAASVAWPEWTDISPLAHIVDIPRKTPILIFAGGADAHATVAEARRLHERVAEHARLVVIEGADHNGLLAIDPRGVRERRA
jgi:alpha/beta superfamily hydrolase